MRTPEEIARSVLNSSAASDPDSLTAAFADSLRTYAESQVAKERERWEKVVEAAGHMRDWLYECSIDPEESHTVRNQARELVAAFDAAKEAK